MMNKFFKKHEINVYENIKSQGLINLQIFIFYGIHFGPKWKLKHNSKVERIKNDSDFIDYWCNIKCFISSC